MYATGCCFVLSVMHTLPNSKLRVSVNGNRLHGSAEPRFSLRAARWCDLCLAWLHHHHRRLPHHFRHRRRRHRHRRHHHHLPLHRHLRRLPRLLAPQPVRLSNRPSLLAPRFSHSMQTPSCRFAPSSPVCLMASSYLMLSLADADSQKGPRTATGDSTASLLASHLQCPICRRRRQWHPSCATHQ